MAVTKNTNEPDDIAQLRKRYEKLNRDKTVAETQLESARESLNLLRQKAREDYGTDDLALLREKLEQMKQENQRKRSEYQKSLDQIEADLLAVEAKYKQAAAGNG
jgi:chromosome segregation ATPase